MIFERCECVFMNRYGRGVCRAQGESRPIYVDGAVTGDVLDVRVLSETERYVDGEIAALRAPSPHRVQPDCAVFGGDAGCGGCTFAHIDRALELEIKRAMVKGALRSAGCRVVDVAPVFDACGDARGADAAGDGHVGGAACDTVAGNVGGASCGAAGGHGTGSTHDTAAGRYISAARRNKAVVHFARGSYDYGFNVRAGGDVVALPPAGCPRLSERMNSLFAAGADVLRRLRVDAGALRGMYVREGEVGEALFALLTRGGGLDPSVADAFADEFASERPDVTGVLENAGDPPSGVPFGGIWRTLRGRGYVWARTLGLRLRVSAASFRQTNDAAADALYTLALDAAALRPGETALDLYCGTGSIALALAARCPGAVVRGVEISPDAVADARENARKNGIGNVAFECADAERIKKSAVAGADVVVLDPPRSGCSRTLLEAIEAKRIVYVSCNPATLGRDICILRGRGYDCGTIRPVDMFPRAGHVETVVLITRNM
jgi:23S rRNA (uracil1939-C5)-methyltransferase